MSVYRTTHREIKQDLANYLLDHPPAQLNPEIMADERSRRDALRQRDAYRRRWVDYEQVERMARLENDTPERRIGSMIGCTMTETLLLGFAADTDQGPTDDHTTT